ncbi:MAG: peptidylprolyl isomerase [Planctomycetota bacterium]
MKRPFALPLAALLLVSGLALRAQEQPPQPGGFTQPVPAKLELALTASKPEVSVGALVTLTVTLKNVGVDPVTLPKLDEDRQLVSFDLQLNDGRVFAYERIHPNPYAAKLDWPTGELKPGESWTYETHLPALCTGDLTVTAYYGRKTAPKLNPKPPVTASKPLKLKLVPAANGAERVRVRLITSLGPIDLRLFPEEALGTCCHFARLVIGQAKPFYKGLTFHRVIPNFMIQGGCPLGNGLGDGGYSIPAEFAQKGPDGKVPEKLRHVPGKLSMAHSSHDDSAGTQFFITTATSPHLDGSYTCFGEVTRGMDVALTIAEVDTDQNNKPKEPVRIVGIRIEPEPKR